MRPQPGARYTLVTKDLHTAYRCGWDRLPAGCARRALTRAALGATLPCAAAACCPATWRATTASTSPTLTWAGWPLSPGRASSTRQCARWTCWCALDHALVRAQCLRADRAVRPAAEAGGAALRAATHTVGRAVDQRGHHARRCGSARRGQPHRAHKACLQVQPTLQQQRACRCWGWRVPAICSRPASQLWASLWALGREPGLDPWVRALRRLLGSQASVCSFVERLQSLLPRLASLQRPVRVRVWLEVVQPSGQRSACACAGHPLPGLAP